MCKDKPYFADAKVGDSVYEMTYGEGKIEEINLNFPIPIIVSFPGHLSGSFSLGGVLSSGFNQTLFYSKPIFELPPPPKRKVKKVIDGWMNIYCDNDDFMGGVIFRTKAIADGNQSSGRVGKAHFVRHEYEE